MNDDPERVKSEAEMRRQFPFGTARIARRWRKLLDERLKDLGVTQARWNTMVALHRGGEGTTQRDLAELMSIENPTLVRLLDNLENQELIERRACKEDRRARRLYLTARGRAFMEELDERAESLRDQLLNGITKEELEICLNVFDRVIENSDHIEEGELDFKPSQKTSLASG